MSQRACRRPKGSHVPLIITASLGLLSCGVGTVLAQETAVAPRDQTCEADCQRRGYDGEFCGRACQVPQASLIPADEVTDWICLTACRERGGRLLDCLPQCRRP